MGIIGIAIIAALGFFALIGLITGLIKGFTKVRSWAAELLLTGVCGISLSKLIAKNVQGAVPGFVSLGITVAFVCLFMLLFAIIRKALKSKIEKRKQLSYYKQYDEREDNTEQILSALGTEDKKKYKKLTKRKFKQSCGGWGVCDKILGGLFLAVKGAVITGFIAAFALVIVDFTRLAQDGGSLNSLFGGIYQSGAWAFFKGYIFDFIIVGLVTVCIKSGFQSGISSTLWSLLVLGMVVGAAVLSFNLAFNAQDFVSVAEKLQTKLPEMVAHINVAKSIIGVGLFLLMLVAVILIAVFVPKLIDRARDSAVFRGVDGVFGAIILTAFITGLLLVVGAVVNNLHDMQFMLPFNGYFDKSGIATYFYDKNILNALGVLNDLPIKGWLE